MSHDSFSNQTLAVAAFPTHCPSACSRGWVGEGLPQRACKKELKYVTGLGPNTGDFITLNVLESLLPLAPEVSRLQHSWTAICSQAGCSLASGGDVSHGGGRQEGCPGGGHRAMATGPPWGLWWGLGARISVGRVNPESPGPARPGLGRNEPGAGCWAGL